MRAKIEIDEATRERIISRLAEAAEAGRAGEKAVMELERQMSGGTIWKRLEQATKEIQEEREERDGRLLTEIRAIVAGDGDKTRENVATVGAVAVATQKIVTDGVDRMEALHDKALGEIDEVRREAVKRIFDAFLKGRNLTAEDADLLDVCRKAWERVENITMEEAGKRLKKPHGKHWVSEHYHKLVGKHTGWGFQSMASAVKSAGSYNPEALGHNPQK